jgi:hypothetical protein
LLEYCYLEQTKVGTRAEEGWPNQYTALQPLRCFGTAALLSFCAWQCRMDSAEKHRSVAIDKEQTHQVETSKQMHTTDHA